MMKFEVDAECTNCDVTGIYDGFGEIGQAGVVCHTCNGTGCKKISISYKPFEERKIREGINRVHQVNPGICIDDSEVFGGVRYADWLDFEDPQDFPLHTENRGYTCPAWWYQSADYSKKPTWKECIWGGTFSSCEHFPTKQQCWERFDSEFSGEETT